MAILPSFTIDPTLEAAFKFMEAGQGKREKRDYLGASIIGHSCERFIYYNLHNPDQAAPIEAKGLAAIADGHATELVVIERLRAVPGIEIWNQNEDGSQIGFTDGKFSGHVDGIILGLLQAPKTAHVLEVKCCNEKKFNELKKLVQQDEKSALEKWDMTYFAQAQSYMSAFDLTRHYLVCATPGGRDMTSCRTDFDKVYHKNLMGKKDRILASQTPPERISSDSAFYICKFCRFRDFCWKEK